jgi:hypothetical protein
LVVAATEADAASSPLCELLHGATSAVESVLFLAPPTDEEVAAYVAWRLSQCDVRTQFSDDACRLISHFAQGRFNLVNALCQLTLRDHQRQPVATIDTAMVKRAAVSFAALQEKAAKSARRGPKKVGADDSADGSPAETRHDRLIVSENRTVVKQVALTGRLVIGRSQDSDLCLPSKFVSRFHAAILPAADGHYFVVNLNSRNGVLVNRTFVSQSALHHGDLLDIGPFRIKVELNEATTAELDAELDDTDRMPAPTFALTPISAVKR